MKDKVRITDKDSIIIEVIKSHVGAIGPTEIGMKLGQSYNAASSYCTKSLKKLLTAGEIFKIKTDKVRYKISNHSNK